MIIKKLASYLPFYTVLHLPSPIYPVVDASAWIGSRDSHAMLDFRYRIKITGKMDILNTTLKAAFAAGQ
jgi:hypothetical protein